MRCHSAKRCFAAAEDKVWNIDMSTLLRLSLPSPDLAGNFVMACHSFAFLYLIYICASVAATNCYFPNGTDANPVNQALQRTPCFSDGPSNIASMCCHVGDTCRSDGLCDNSYQDGSLTRDTCTDPSWNSPNCIKLCTNGTSRVFHARLWERMSTED